MKKRTIDISVLMSVYNETIQEIGKAIDSILVQSKPDFEFIIVIDNPDRKDYVDFLTEYAKQDERIIILQNTQNIGLAASMNKALALAKGKIIARMDADDISVSTRFQKEYDLLSRGGSDVVFTNYTRIGSDGEYLDNGRPACNLSDERDFTEQIVFNGVVHHPTVMMKKEAIQRVNGYRLFPCSQDQDLWIRMLESGATFMFLDEVLLYYRVRSEGISQKKGIQQYETIQYILNLLKERIDHDGQDSFSEESYRKHIAKRCADAQKQVQFNAAVSYLSIAKDADKIRKNILRIKAFCISKTIRDAFLFRFRNKKQFIAYLSRKGSTIGGEPN